MNKSKQRSTSTAEARKEHVLSLLKQLGQQVFTELDQGRFPTLRLKSRSVKNIVYDRELQQFVLGPAEVKRYASNIKHIRPFTQLIWLAYFAKKLVKEKRTSTLRDVYYSAQAFNIDFVDQAESDELITDLEVLLQLAREDFNIYPEERSAIFGNMTIEYTVPGYEGKRLDLSSHPDGVMIGPALTTAEFVDTDAEIVLAIEKGGLFTRFIEERVHERYKAILVNTAGQPPRSTRYLLRRLNQELKLPVGILCDADPWGAHIAMVIKSGSVRYHEPIVIKKHGKISLIPIGKFVDDCISEFGYCDDGFGNEVCPVTGYETLTLDYDGRVKFKPILSAIRHIRNEDIYSVKTMTGRSVEVTETHSLFVLRDGLIKSIPTSQLKIGDLLVVAKNVSFEQDFMEKTFDGIGKVFGYYIANGMVEFEENLPKSVVISVYPKKNEVKRILKCIKSISKQVDILYLGDVFGKLRIEIRSPEFVTYLIKHAGYKVKHVPEILFVSRKEALDFVETLRLSIGNIIKLDRNVIQEISYLLTFLGIGHSLTFDTIKLHYNEQLGAYSGNNKVANNWYLFSTPDSRGSLRLAVNTETNRVTIGTRSVNDTDIFFDPVVSIENIEVYDKYVYDISIPYVERFIGGRSGILLHNSANAAHLRELTTPSAVWLGVWASDIVKYKLPSDKLTDIDIKRLYELKQDPRYTEKMWHNELDMFLKIKRKSEQEAFARYGLSYIVDKYLPEKLELLKS